MKNLDTFIQIVRGTRVDALDISNIHQCLDLALMWVRYLYPGFQRFGVIPAYEVYTKFEDSRFQKVPNKAKNEPPTGALVVWGKTFNNGPGHIAIATGQSKVAGNSSDWFKAFSQNNPTGTPSTVQVYSFNNVLGWLVPDVRIINEKINYDDFEKNITLANEFRKLTKHNSRYINAIAVLNTITERDNAIRNKDLQIKDINKYYGKKLKEFNDEIILLKKEIEILKNSNIVEIQTDWIRKFVEKLIEIDKTLSKNK